VTVSTAVAQLRASGVRDIAGIDSVLHNCIEELLWCLAGCDRIRGTPCPAGHVGVLRLGLIAFLALLPWVLLAELEWMSVVIVSISAFVLFAVEDVALQARPRQSSRTLTHRLGQMVDFLAVTLG
jgi:predicted membrane chloride channel (bestrophin family)